MERPSAGAVPLLIFAGVAATFANESSGEPELPAAAVPPTQEVVPTGDVVRFLVIGDQGSGSPVQQRVAGTMKSICEQRGGCDFVIATGDNIYFFGPLTGPKDPHFVTHFELPYRDLDMPFYLTLGNHDDGFTGDFTIFGDHEVQYTYEQDRMSEKWNMPARYYTVQFGDLLQTWSIDGDTIDLETQFPNTDFTIGQLQRKWLRRTLRRSNARWKIAFGHYNYGSNGNYGNAAPAFRAALEKSLCDRVQFYLHGHEHDLRWLAPQPSCGRTEFIVSGAAGHLEVRPEANLGYPQYAEYRATPGFVFVEIKRNSFTGVFYDWDGNSVFERTVTKRALGW